MVFNKYQLSSLAMSSFYEYTKTTRFEMTVNVWMSIALSVFICLANAFERPSCPSNEEIFLPHPDDCKQFYICQNGLAYPAACLSGMQWNQTQGWCIHSDVDNNYQQSKTLFCPLDDDPSSPKHIPDANDCGQFYKCLGGDAYPMKCTAGKHWSVELNRCEHPSVANCHQQRQSRSMIQNGDINYDCPLDDDPNNPTLLWYPGECAKFYKCSYGRSYVMSCPFGLHWDVSSNRCESPFIAKCQSGGETTTRTTPTVSPPGTTRTTSTTSTTRTTRTTRTTTTTRTTPTTRRPDPNPLEPMPQCTDNNSVQKFGIPGECNWFMQCYQGNAFRVKCREGREWSSIRNDCIDAAIAGCSSSPGYESTTPISTTAISSTTSTTAQIPTSCDEGVEYLRHPTNCHKYIQCDNGNPLERDCPPPLYFSRKMRRCEWTANDC